MKKIKKLVAIQPVSILEENKEKLKEFCEEIIFFDSQPESAEEIVERIGDADAVFVSYTHAIGEEILAKCPNLVYIGMCCSLYSEESSNVDIAYAREHGITVTGIRDYGDEGVASTAFRRKFGDFRCEDRITWAWGKRAGSRKSIRRNGSADQLLQPDEKTGTGRAGGVPLL